MLSGQGGGLPSLISGPTTKKTLVLCVSSLNNSSYFSLLVVVVGYNGLKKDALTPFFLRQNKLVVFLSTVCSDGNINIQKAFDICAHEFLIS